MKVYRAIVLPAGRKSKVVVKSFEVIKETPKCYQIKIPGSKPILKRKNVGVFESKEMALKAFINEEARQVEYFTPAHGIAINIIRKICVNIVQAIDLLKKLTEAS